MTISCLHRYEANTLMSTWIFNLKTIFIFVFIRDIYIHFVFLWLKFETLKVVLRLFSLQGYQSLTINMTPLLSLTELSKLSPKSLYCGWFELCTFPVLWELGWSHFNLWQWLMLHIEQFYAMPILCLDTNTWDLQGTLRALSACI